MAQITIPLYYDLDLLLWTSAAGGIARQPNLVLGQSDSIAFAVQFVRSGVVIELTSPAWICGIKPINDVAGDYLCQTTTGVKTGATTTTVYTFTLLLDSDELRAWLLTVTAVSNYAAFSIRDTVNLIATLPAITCTILPDYTLEGTTPTAASGTLIVDSGQTFTVHKTFAMPTDDGFDTYVLKTNGAGVGSWAADNAGTGTVTSVAQTFTGGIIQVSGSPITTSGTLALTIAGSQGGIVYFTTNSGWGSTGPLGAGGLIVGGGTSIPTVLAAVASGRVLTSAGTLTTPAYSSTITLGASGTLGTITLGNATSGTILITPPTGALGTVTLTLPITSTTLAGLAVTQTFSANQTFSGIIDIAATTSTAGQITQATKRILHTYGGATNVFIGTEAGNFTGIGFPTFAIGTGNVGIGRACLQGLTSGTNNLCFGDGTAFTLTSGISNIIIGQAAGTSITSGSTNCAVGVASLGSLSITSDNCAFGHQALGLQTGSQNTGIGKNAGYYSTSNNGTYIGQSAGIATATVGGLAGAQITSGANCTMLGQASSSTSATGNYRTAIGSDSRCNVNNSIKLGRDHTSTVAGDMVSLPSVLTANLPVATAAMAGAIIYVSDDGTGHINFCNGTAWARIN